MKIDRLIGIITLLLRQDKVTAPQLAERFEVSRRTINRDIEDICRAGIPIITTQGYGGGISIAGGYRIDKALLTEEEMQAVFTGLRGIDSVSGTSCLAALLDKLSGREKHMAADDTVLIDLASHYQKSLIPKIELIKRGIREKRYFTFTYYYEKGEQRRTIEPYRLVFKWSSWYVFGYCTDRAAFRLFKLNRLWEPALSGKHFTGRELPAEEAEPADYPNRKNFHLRALFAPSEKHRLIDEYGIGCFTCQDGRLLFEWDFASYENMREWIFSFGDRVCILEPQRLVDDRIRQAGNILKRNGS